MGASLHILGLALGRIDHFDDEKFEAVDNETCQNNNISSKIEVFCSEIIVPLQNSKSN